MRPMSAMLSPKHTLAAIHHAFYTCNVWTGRALATAGVKVSAWTPFTSGVLYHLPEQ
jgi:Protein of unknown function (DUF2459)